METQEPQTNYVTKNPLRVPMCEWCDHFKRRKCAEPNSRFGVCHRPGSTHFQCHVPVSLPGCRHFSHPYIKFKDKKIKMNDNNINPNTDEQ